MHDPRIRDRATFRHPPFSDHVLDYFAQCRQPHAECLCRVRYIGVGMTMQEEQHAGLQRRHAERGSSPSEFAVQLQHEFEGASVGD